MSCPASVLIKNGVITGASKGLGKVFAIEFARAGANLLLTARSAERLEDAKRQVEELGVQCRVVVGDITDDSVLEAVVQAALEEGVEILVNSDPIGVV